MIDRRKRRSEGMAQALSTPPGEQTESWERLEALYRSSRDDVYAYALTLLRESAAAEDVTALAFERAYRRRRTFDRRRGEERAWLFGIARNAALDELRRRKRLATLVIDPASAEEQEATDDGPEVTLRRTAVRTALASLAGRDRELIALKFHAGLSNAEIARGARDQRIKRRNHAPPHRPEAEESLQCDCLKISRSIPRCSPSSRRSTPPCAARRSTPRTPNWPNWRCCSRRSGRSCRRTPRDHSMPRRRAAVCPGRRRPAGRRPR